MRGLQWGYSVPQSHKLISAALDWFYGFSFSSERNLQSVFVNGSCSASKRRFLSLLYGASPRVSDGGVGLKLWRLAADILNKQSWTADLDGLT